MADSPGFSSHDSTGLVAPIIAGALIQNMLFGVLIVVFCDFIGSSGWARQSWAMRTVIVVVCALTAISTGLYMHDIFFYSLTFTSDFQVLNASTVAAGTEPVFVGVIGAIVQQTLSLRAARIIQTGWVRWLYRIVIGMGSLLVVLSSVGVTCSSIGYTLAPIYLDQLSFPIQIGQFIQAWAWSSAVTDALISVSYIIIIRSLSKDANEVAKGVITLIARYVLESAMYTTLFAVASAITVEATDQNDPAQYDMSYISWMPCSSLYALSLFTTLNIADRVHERLSEFQPEQHSRSAMTDFSLAGSFFTTRRGSLVPPRRGSSPARKSPLESMITKPGEPAWEQRSTSFLGVRIPLAFQDEADVGGRPAFRRAQSSAV